MAEWLDELIEKRVWNKISEKKLDKELRRLESQIKRQQKKLERLGNQENNLLDYGAGKTEIVKQGIKEEVKDVRREARTETAILKESYYKRTTYKRVKLYKRMEKRYNKKGIESLFKKNHERIINKILEMSGEFIDSIKFWERTAEDTDIMLDTVFVNDDEDEEIMAAFAEREYDKQMEGIETDRNEAEKDDKKWDSIKSKNRKKY